MYKNPRIHATAAQSTDTRTAPGDGLTAPAGTVTKAATVTKTATVTQAGTAAQAVDPTAQTPFPTGDRPTGPAKDLSLATTPKRVLFLTRGTWLLVLTAFGAATSTLVANQEELLSSVLILAAFIAPIVDMGGNTGSQSATLVIRGMAVGEMRPTWRHIGRVLRKELPVALSLAAMIGVAQVIVSWWTKHPLPEVLLVIGLTMATVTLLGALLGTLLPFAAAALRIDPASLSAPLITSIMDLLGVVIYFALAYAFLGHLIG